MAKDVKAKSKGQKTLDGFFKGDKDKKKAEDASDGDEEDVTMRVDEEDAPVVKNTGLSTHLPPLNDLSDIFHDLVGRTPGIKDVALRLSGRKLRVATMCSGTESPLLALEFIQQFTESLYGVKLDVEHVFSCEIEPFKQAYIERNFHPPKLFRDVCELGAEEAHTAYGALVPVPGNVDLLVAGTSCVDYSNLNNEKQDIDANGESGRTFRGMMSWVTKHRPPLVILENVCSAPWDRVKEKFEKHGYSALHLRVDTKQYYIPHTRTRVYLMAIDKKNSSIPKKWKESVEKLRRPASSSLDSFLLPIDDPRIHHARQKLAQESYNASDRRTGRTDWSRCESRHQRARLEEELGSKRPLTSWDEGGSCKMPDYSWTDWGAGQVERVWDLLDISLLRDAKKGIDASFKTQVWNLSQNVDRTIGSNKVGICPCLTPSMIPYITNRGGPMVGLEALSMQGLPVDKLLLTRETEDQLADLAGNAMSSTVVAACILSALIEGVALLKTGDEKVCYGENDAVEEDQDDDAMDVDEASPELPVGDRIVGEERLVFKPLDLSATQLQNPEELLALASRSIRLCSCEGRVDITSRPLFRCKDCDASFCKRCGGRPEHNPEAIDVVANPRLPPSDFEKVLKSVLPMCLSLSNVTEELLDKLNKETPGNSKRWAEWRAAVLQASGSELRFVELKRQEIWSAIYQSPHGSAELHLHPQQPEWRFFAKPKDSEPAKAEIRQILENPFGRLLCRNSLLAGQWAFALPKSVVVEVTLKGSGSLAPSWESRLGLLGDTFREKKVWSEMHISVAEPDKSKFDRDISGTYQLLDRCGTACNALHKQQDGDDSQPQLYMFLVPHRTKDSEDCFLFSTDIRRLEFGESRPVIAQLDPKWRQSDTEDLEKVNCVLPFHWATSSAVSLQPTLDQDARFGIPENTFEVSSSNDACQQAQALLSCTVPLRGQSGAEWPMESWDEVDKIHERGTFRSLAWLFERIKDVSGNFTSWQQVEGLDHSNCERCAPTAPEVQYLQVKNKIVGVEDPVQAGEYERRLKRRPSPFVTQLKLAADGTGSVRIGINIPSLLHRALSRLPSEGRTEDAVLSWRLDTNFTPTAALNLPKFTIMSNKLDKEHAQPPSFKIPLRKEQTRSLEWMIHQEDSKAEPFVEEEVSEALLDPLGWRAEGLAQRPVHIRGGVLADQVGYGKTAITLGLIDCTWKQVEAEFAKQAPIDGKIAIKATLVIVPPHLTRQWDSEVRKFTGKRFKTLVLSTVSNLNSATIEDFQEADIIIVASNIFKSNVYLENLSSLAAVGPLPSKDGRQFNDHLRTVLSSLKVQTNRLREEGSEAMKAAITEGQKKAEEDAAKASQVQSKRLKGKSYRDAAEVLEKKDQDQKKTAQPQNSPSNGQGQAKRTRTILDSVEIAINRGTNSGPRSSPSAPDTSSGVEEEEEDDFDVPKKRARRAAVRKPIVVDSDDDSSDASEPKLKSKSKKASTTKSSAKAGRARKPAQRKRTKSDDDDDSFAENSDGEEDSDESDNGSVVLSDDDDPAPKSKSKKKPAAKKPKARATPSSTSEDDMDVDDPPKPSTKKGKRKAPDDGNRPTKKQRVDSDPWKLGSAKVHNDWTRMQAPPLEMFHFSRLVVDEYTYLDGKIHALVTNLGASRQWVLSGTPPIHDFGALKTISAFLNVHLGIDDDSEGQSAEVKKRRRERTDVEKFHSFREVHTLEWHGHRHTVGQRFLDRFVRQNIAEIDEIPWSPKNVKIILPAAERAIYLELEHYLRALDMTVKRGKKTESDREKRVAQSLGESKTAEEALLKRCSHFEVETNNENAMKACDVIVRDRQKQLDECKENLLSAVKDAVKREKDLNKKLNGSGGESMFLEWLRICETEGVDDSDATEIVRSLIKKADAPTPTAKSRKDDVKLSESMKELIWDHREKTHEIRRLTKELVGRVRSLRYFTVVRDLQKQRAQPPKLSCPVCGRDDLPVEDASVLSSCGHIGCNECVKSCAEKEECVYSTSGCKAAARVINIVKAETLGVDDVERDGKGKHYGMKLEQIVKSIKKQISKDDRILVFVQFPDLMKKVAEAFDHHKIDYLEIRGSASQKSKSLEKFQNDSKERVLLLNVMDESASGANLTSASHAIFISPLLAPSQEIYDACETQAIGRLIRYGQTKHVNIYRFWTENTIDEEVYSQRRKIDFTL
ncbi:hypothetical protein GYMLUDRAFT_51100 [Collybiopsis luxurians FD-317 M1]|uniref:Helicase C-terminal domain-containing protein n=1 Tax=Collybiopsis luxurians FD-317 M1 TaxID=944289 RepID=A0A0D0BYT6_9AGAR|nr:hypothetical protein GYMLUDRAFT_51100 [Collybiopsis luxurians FD-317 M1]